MEIRGCNEQWQKVANFTTFCHCHFVHGLKWTKWQKMGYPKAPMNVWPLPFKGAGGGLRSIFTFWLFLKEGNASYQEIFSERKILFLAKVIAFSNLENTYNYIARTNFNCDSPKINIKIYLLLQFWSRPLKRESFCRV